MDEHRVSDEDPEALRPPRTYRLVAFVLDRVLAHVRWALWPFGALTRLLGAAAALGWLLSNEHRKRSFGHCGTGVRIHGRFFVSAPEQLHVGDNVHINRNAFLRAEGGLFIGDNVHISRNLLVYTMNHAYEGELLPYDSRQVLKPVRIERNVWIGMNVVIAPGVTIGEGAVIGIGTVVSRDVAPLAVVGSGAPREIKRRDEAHYRRLDERGRYGAMSGHAWEDPRATPEEDAGNRDGSP